MRRLHLFEFEDLGWFPDFLRRAMTRYLKTVVDMLSLPALWADKLAALAPPEGVFRIVDLGSGSGGSMKTIVRALGRKGCFPEVTVTDLYPNPDSIRGAGSAFQYWPVRVDATSVPPELTGTRTMFLAFHHHRPDHARAILRDAFERRIGIAVFEFSARKPMMLLSCLQIPVAVLLVTPMIRPLKVSQLFFTYLIPLVPILMLWDGVVSHLRTYSPAELQAMTADMQSPDYAWETGELAIPLMLGAFPWLIGRPR